MNPAGKWGTKIGKVLEAMLHISSSFLLPGKESEFASSKLSPDI